MTAINDFLLTNDLRLTHTPCVSPDFCLDWPSLAADIQANRGMKAYPLSEFQTAEGSWSLAANAQGDHAWLLRGESANLRDRE
jgi:hypothetical protein